MSVDTSIGWAQVIDAIDMAVSVHDRHHVVRLANRAFLERVGKPASEVIGQKCHRLAHCSEEPLPDCPHAELLSSGKPVEREFTTPDETAVVGISCFPLKDSAGELFGSVHIVRDVTEVSKLRERSDRRSTAVAGYLETLKGHLRTFNRPIIGKDIPFENDHIQACYELRDCREHECPARLGGGQRCWHAPSTRCERDGLTDVVDRLAFCQMCEVYQKASPDDLTALAELFNDMVYLLREKQLQLVRSERMLVLGELSATLAHELRSPLNSLSISTQRLGRKLKSGDIPAFEEMDAFQKGMMQDVRRLDDFIEEFILSVKRPLRPKHAVLLAGVIDEVSSQVRTQTARKAVNLDVCCHTPDVQLSGEVSEHLSIILLNLVLNAVEATSEGDCINVSCLVEGGEILVEVTNSGSVIPDEILPRIFEPFFSTKRHGTGLGLAIISWLVERNDGKVAVSSSTDLGTTFSVRFPHAGPGEAGMSAASGEPPSVPSV
jgi:PAS domain S-box-containing protein